MNSAAGGSVDERALLRRVGPRVPRPVTPTVTVTVTACESRPLAQPQRPSAWQGWRISRATYQGVEQLVDEVDAHTKNDATCETYAGKYGGPVSVRVWEVELRQAPGTVDSVGFAADVPTATCSKVKDPYPTQAVQRRNMAMLA